MKKLTQKLHIDIETCPVSMMRYKTIGDWLQPLDNEKRITMNVFVADMGNTDCQFLVGIHELIESYLCLRHGITDTQVTAFDKAHLTAEEPGNLEAAPYHKEHQIATDIEAMLSVALGIKWKEYDEVVNKTLKKYKKK